MPGTAFVRTSSLMVCAEDCVGLQLQARGVCCSHCRAAVGSVLEEAPCTLDLLKDKVSVTTGEPRRGLYSLLRRVLVSLVDVYRSKACVRFFCFAKNKHFTVVLNAPVAYVQVKAALRVRQAIHFSVSEEPQRENDVCLPFSLLDAIAFLAALKRAAFDNDELISFQPNQYYFLLSRACSTNRTATKGTTSSA